MKRILSSLCALSLALSFMSVFANNNNDKEYAAEGGYFTTNSRGVTIYHNTDGANYEYYPNEDTVNLYYINSSTGNATVPETINGAVVKFVSGFDGNKQSLESLVLHDSVTEIENFSGYEKLKSVKLSNSLTEIGYSTFSQCRLLESIEIPSSVTKIEQGAFSNCTSLRSVVFNEGLISIGERAFADCPIDDIKLPSTLANIGRACFINNKALKIISIPKNIKRIEKNAFQHTAIEKVEFKGKVEYMDYAAFSGEQLNEVNGLSKDDMIQFWTAFANTPWQKQMIDENEPFLVDKNGKLVAYVGTKTEIELPDTVKTIDSGAFSCKSITSIIIPSSVETIEEMAFYQCEDLRSVTIPASVTQIGQMAFQNCYRLKNITFEYSDKTLNLGSSAFAFTLASPETVVTNNRSYSNKKTAFQNTYFEEDYVPVSKNGVSYDDEYVEPTQSPEPLATPNVITTESPIAAVKPMPEVTEKSEMLTVTTQNDKILISASDKEVVFADAQPFIDENDRTQIPVRAVAEALDCTVDWDALTQTVTLSKDNTAVIIKIGDSNMQIGKNIVTMDTTAQIVNDRTYIPVRFVGEALGMTVNWESE